MEWTNLRSQSSSFVRPRYWQNEGADDQARSHEMWQLPPSNARGMEEGARQTFASEMECSRTLSSEARVSLQPLSSLRLPQLDETAEFQPFSFYSHPPSCLDTGMLSPSPSPLVSAPSLDEEALPSLKHEVFGQVPVQFGLPLPEVPEEPDDYLRSILPASIPAQQATIRPSLDVFSDGVPTLHNVHSSVPTVPARFGPLEHPPPQQIFPLMFEDQTRDLDDTIAQGMPPTMFRTSTISFADSSEPLVAQASWRESTNLEFFPLAKPPGRAKRGTGLSEPFTDMVVTEEPKFSSDRRKLCSVEGCRSQARAFNRCKRHGGSKRCASPGCTKSVQSRGLCIRHGGGSRCQEQGCTRASQSQGRCKLHGGGRPCLVAGCDKKAHLKRLCRKHGGGTKCGVPGCTKWSQREGMCMTHAKGMGPPTQRSGPTRMSTFGMAARPPDLFENLTF